jgi:hypothetical protein
MDGMKMRMDALLGTEKENVSKRKIAAKNRKEDVQTAVKNRKEDVATSEERRVEDVATQADTTAKIAEELKNSPVSVNIEVKKEK